jgi:hypothetical protein
MLTIQIRLRPLTDPNVANRFSGHITILDPNTLSPRVSKFFDIDNPPGLRAAIAALINSELTAAGIAVS